MKRTPLQRRTGLKPSGKPLQRTTGLPRSRSALKPFSAKRRREQPQRDACEAEVLARDVLCRYPGCRFASTEVHELQRGQMRALTYLDPAKCIGLCGFLGANHHQWVGEHPQEAHDLGLAKWSWE